MTTHATCGTCGSDVDPGAQFCSGCGSDVTGEQGAAKTAHIKASATQQMQMQLLNALRDATLGDYEILTQLGQGGMATVYLAHDISLDRKVAVKVMNPALVSGEGMVERFKLEARTAAGLSHPHIIPIYAVKETHDLLFFVMKFIEGRPLDSIIKEAAPLPIPMVRTVVTKIGEALGYAHRRGVIHRDIKPANIMIDTEGMPIVTDFGIAKVADKQGLTMTGATIGTPTYMSPEQCNALEITGASDQYSLGVVAYEMLTGRPLYDGDSVMTIMFKHVHDEPPEPATLGPHVPADLAAAIIKMLQKDVAARWGDIEQALPQLSGGQAAYDDSVRTALIEFAKHGENREILKRVSTPRSPIPVGQVSSAATVRLSSGTQEPAAQTAAAPRKSRKGLWIGLTGLLVAGGAAAVVFLGPLAPGPGPVPAEPTPVAIGNELPPAQPPAVDPAAAESVTPAPTTAAPAAATTTTPPPVRPAGPAPIRSVRIDNPPGALQPQQQVTLRATVLDANGAAVNRRVNWSSSNRGVASVTPAGVVQAIAAGESEISATVNGFIDRVTITVSAIPVTAVSVSPNSGTLDVGGTLQLTATPTAANGVSLPDREVRWSSNNAAVASVTDAGLVQANGQGTANIAATSGNATGSSTITVNAPVVELDHRALIGDAINGYARALSGRDIGAVKTVFPGLSGQRERDLRESLGAMERVTVTPTIRSISLNGNRATADVRMTWRYRAGGSDGTLEADGTYMLTRQGDRWVISDIQDR